MGVALVAALISWLGREQHRLPAPLAWSQAQFEAAMGRPAQAMRWYQIAVAIDPADPLPRMQMAGFLVQSGSAERALTELQHVAATNDLEPDFMTQLHEMRADAHLALGNVRAALAEISAARALHVDDTRWRDQRYFAMGIGSVTDRRLHARQIELLIRMGETDQAWRQYEELRIDSPSTGPMVERLRRLRLQLPPR